jgi:hypothetical protein
LEFSVASMKRSDAAGDTSNEALTVTPEGEFILLTFTVHNTSTVPKMYSTVPQVIIGENGTRYPSDTTAFLYANTEIVAIQPDETVTVTEAFRRSQRNGNPRVRGARGSDESRGSAWRSKNITQDYGRGEHLSFNRPMC